MNRIYSYVILIALLLLGGCEQEELYPARDNAPEREAFFAQFNKKTIERLHKEKKELEEALAFEMSEQEVEKNKNDLAGLEEQAKSLQENGSEDGEELQKQIKEKKELLGRVLSDADRRDKQKLLDDLNERLKRPTYLERYTESQLPADLKWETNLDEPEIGSDEAKKGGTLHTYIPGNAYPPTIRTCGAQANNSFRGFHWDDVEMGLIDLHPNTGAIIPAIADRWAVGENGREVYFHIDEDARWSDGRKITSEDWVMAFYVYLSPYLSEAFYRIYYAEQFWGIATYGPDYLCIRNAYPKPMAPYFAGDIPPLQEEFYKEFGPDFEERYNWRVRPASGPYIFKEEDLKKGRSIAQTRVKDWWAKDKKYYKNRFNVDRIEYKLVRSQEKQFQMFLRGDLDFFYLGTQEWYEDSEVDEVFNGYIERATFYHDYPRPSRGLYINTIMGALSNQDVRIGLSYATNWEKFIKIDLRGDAERLNLMHEGYGDISNPDVQAREFSVKKAREAFARAGYTKVGKGGVLENDAGQRLSFTITSSKRPDYESMMRRIKEEAIKAGVEYKLEFLDAQEAFKKVASKQHEIAIAGWAISPPFPDYYQFLHTKEAFIPGTREPMPMTNNVMSFSDPEVDPILEANRNARSYEQVVETSHQIEQIIHDRALWVPAYQRPFYRIGYWRWVRWPDDFNVKLAYEAEITHVHWIDEDIKAETLEAMKAGKSFGEKELLFDQYKVRRNWENADATEDKGSSDEAEPTTEEEPVDEEEDPAVIGEGEAADNTAPSEETGEGGEEEP